MMMMMMIIEANKKKKLATFSVIYRSMIKINRDLVMQLFFAPSSHWLLSRVPIDLLLLPESLFVHCC